MSTEKSSTSDIIKGVGSGVHTVLQFNDSLKSGASNVVPFSGMVA